MGLRVALIMMTGVLTERGYLDLETHRRAQGEDNCLQAKERGLGQVSSDPDLQNWRIPNPPCYATQHVVCRPTALTDAVSEPSVGEHVDV